MKSSVGKTLQVVGPETDELARQVVNAAFKVHKHLGPGLLESVYETCLVHELRLRDLEVESQIPFPLDSISH